MLFDTQWIPQFADTLLLHTVPLTRSSISSKHSTAMFDEADSSVGGVKAFRFFPRQQAVSAAAPLDDPASFPVESHVEMGLRCTRADGSFYFSNESADGCLLSELRRTVERVAPQADPIGGGPCYATAADLQRTGCLSGAVPTDPNCAAYRAQCPHLPCGAVPKAADALLGSAGFTSLVDPARGLMCSDVAPLGPEGPYPAGAAAGLVVGGLATGSLVGFFVMKLSFVRIAHLFDDSKPSA
jgi:hypothetical protein